MRQPAVIASGYGTLRPFGFASLLFNRFAFISDFYFFYSIIIVFSAANVNRFWHLFHFCYIFPSYFPWCLSEGKHLCKMHGKYRKNAVLQRFPIHNLIWKNAVFFQSLPFSAGFRRRLFFFLLSSLNPLKQAVYRRLRDLIHCI